MFLSALSEFLRLSSEGVVLSSLLDRPHLPIHMPNFLSRFIQHHPRSRRSQFRRPRHHPNVQWSLTHVSGGRGTAFHSASSVPNPVFRGLRMICGTSHAMFGASFDSATLLSSDLWYGYSPVQSWIQIVGQWVHRRS